MEHISRRTTRDVDHLLLVTDPTQRGVTALRRIVEMVPGLEVNVGAMHVIVNRLPGGEMVPALASAVQDMGVALAGTVPSDPEMAAFEFTGRPLVELPDDSLVVQAVYRIADMVLSNGQD
jgi:CO dehydrogenase maturation factor